jgi:hypothetical protein
MKPSIILGATYRERITGYTGVATAHVRYLTGCSQVLLIPPMHENKLQDGNYFDEQRLVQVEDVPVISFENDETPGGDMLPTKKY